MSKKVSDLRQQFFSWLLANLVGFAALGVLVLSFPALMSITGTFTPFVLIGLPVALPMSR